jgi:Na+-translocating ferredoxin:NAD+ oxidoreductase RnfD subunit
MINAAQFNRHGFVPAAKFLRTPKGILLLILTLLLVLAAPFQGTAQLLPNVLGAVVAAAALDVGIVRARQKRWEFPDGAILTGLIVAFVLRAQGPLAVAVAASLVAIGSKHLLRTVSSNVFNPAALGLVFVGLLFAAGQSWWGALPNLGLAGLAILCVTGLFVADRINKLPLVSVFLGVYLLLFTLAGFLGEASGVAEVFRTPDLQAVLFFAFFMLDDPPTVPVRYEDQVTFAIIVAVASYAVFRLVGAVYFLPAGLLLGNAWESARRVSLRQARASTDREKQKRLRLTPR